MDNKNKTCGLLSSAFGVIAWIVVVLAAVITLLTIVTLIDPTVIGTPKLGVPVSFEVHVGDLVIEHARGLRQMSLTKRGHLIGFWAGLMGALAITFFLVRHVRKIFESAARGRAFDAANRVRFTAIGLSVIGYGVLSHLYYIFTYVAFGEDLSQGDVSPAFSVRLGFILVGASIIALGEIFRQGHKLTEDQDFTV